MLSIFIFPNGSFSNKSKTFFDTSSKFLIFSSKLSTSSFAILANIAKEEVDNLLEKIKNLEEVSKKVLDLFEKLPLGKIKIDNT